MLIRYGILGWLSLVIPTRAGTLDTIGVTPLREMAAAFGSTLTGSGVNAAQVEAGSPTWEVNPTAVGQSASLFTWSSADGTATSFPNGLGNESGHANQVGAAFYGPTSGVAPGIAQLDNYESGYFTDVVAKQMSVRARVINQSFIFVGQIATVDRAYDNYTARFNTLFLNGVGNAGSPSSPATAYNGIAVGAYGGSSSTGPTTDGRAKPDLTAPAVQTSFSAPLVSGAAALLMQAAMNGVGGMNNTSAASDSRTIKALLMNGAEKPSGWTNGPSRPLDARYGAGVINVYNAYRQLRGGQHAFLNNASYGTTEAHPPPAESSRIQAHRGWDRASISSSVIEDRANHYYFNLEGGAGSLFVFKATLVWQIAMNATSINDLDLFLYQAEDGTLVAASQSPVDNVEHLYVNNLGPGAYVLQVLKHGGLSQRVSNNETYALAFEFGPSVPAQLIALTATPSTFQARLQGNPYEYYVIETAGKSLDWFPLLTNVTSGLGRFDFQDTIPAGQAQRFYRALIAP